jgi:hypothetical protein
MQTPSRVVIFLSMIALAGAVAQNVRAAETPAGSVSPKATNETEEEVSPAGLPPASNTASTQPNPAAQAANDGPAVWGGPAQIDHARQFGLSIMPGTGYRLIVPYKELVSCGSSSGNQMQRVCAHVVPFFLETQLSFGIYSRLDFVVDLRFGIQKDPATHGNHQFALAPGFRYWLDQGVRLKFYATGQAVYDYTGYTNVAKSDFAIRNADGIMFDAIRNVGFFFQVGWTMGFVRWFRMELDTGLGVQVRFP